MPKQLHFMYLYYTFQSKWMGTFC